MKVRRTCYVFVSFVVMIALFLVVEPARARKSAGPVRVGDVALGFGGSGLKIWYKDEQLTTVSDADFHEGHFRQHYCYIPRDVTDVKVESGPDSKTLRMIVEPIDKSVRAEYTATARADNTVIIDLVFELKRDMPMCVHYCAMKIVTPPIVGCPFTAKAAGKGRRGIVPLVCPDDGGKRMLASRASEFTVESRLGTIALRTEDGGRWLDVLDARKQSWATPDNPLFWIGCFRENLKQGVKQRLSLVMKFSGAPTPAVAGFKSVGSPAPPVAVPDVVIPAVPTVKPLIPAPKEMTEESGIFNISPATRIVVGKDAAPEDRRAAELVRAELFDRFGVKATVRTSAQSKDWRRGIVIGEPWLNPVAEAACKALGLTVTKENPGPEGYVLGASPSGVVVAGCDRRGTYWGVQTLLQLLRPAKEGHATVACVKIRDWPDFEMRAVHWGCYGKETGFQRRMVERLLARHKVNTLFIECHSSRWLTEPEQWGSVLAELVRLADEHFIEVIPNIQSFGKARWMLGRHPELAEKPNSRMYCPSNPGTYKVMFDVYREVEKAFRSRFVHIGHDELGRDIGICPRCKGKSPAELFAAEVRKLRDYWAERNVTTMMWGDMLLDVGRLPGGLDACNGGPPLDIADAIDKIPKDVIICDWHYGAGYKQFSSIDYFQRHGFRVVAVPWYRLPNIWNLTRAAKKAKTMGVMAGTFYSVNGPEVEPDCLARSFPYLYPLVYSADCMWNAGKRAPDALPYDTAKRFLSALYPQPAGGPPRPGFLVDLSPYCTQALADKPEAPGWLGYGHTRDLSSLPTGRVRLGGTTFLVPSGERNAVMLWGTYAGKAALPVEVKGIAIGKRAAKLLFLHVCGWAAKPGERVGAYRVHYADGTRTDIPLVYARNIAEATHPSILVSARTAWQGEMGDGTPAKVYLYQWDNPNPEKRISAIDFVSAKTRAAPVLLGLSVVSP